MVLDPVATIGCSDDAMRIKDGSVAGARHGQTLTAAGSLVGALAASSCCVLPLVLFGLGVSGAWIGTLTQLAPYQPYFIAATLGFLGAGYWLVYRRSAVVCTAGETCVRPLPNRFVKVGLVVATLLVIVAIGFDLVMPLLINA
jgi:mercuric ion transport protein